MSRWVALVLLAAAVACALRLPQLGRRPLHNDESVNAVKFGELWERGEYRYDPHEYHGPTLHYFTAALGSLTNAPDYTAWSEARLRLLTALVGVALVLAVLLLWDALGRGGIAFAAGLAAVSPALVFYSRYWIHEQLLVLSTLLAFGFICRFLKKPSILWAVLAGVAVGLMQATKETFVLALVAAAGGLLLNWCWRFMAGPQPQMPGVAPAHIAAAICAWLVVWATLFTSFFTNWPGLLDSFRTYGTWIGLAGSDSPHAHRWSFYFERLFWFRSSHGIWSEGFVLVLACLGARDGFRRVPRSGGDGNLVRFLTGYSVVLTLIYISIPYKTPWCALGFLQGYILLAGVGGAVLWQWAASMTGRIAVCAVLLLGMTHLGWQAWRASFPLCDDRANPWVYAHTSPDVLNLVEQVESVAAAGQRSETLIKVVAADGDYWPLPWYLREFSHIGWWAQPPEQPAADIVIASPKLKLRLDDRGGHVMVGYFALRPGVFLELYVEKVLWEQYLAR